MINVNDLKTLTYDSLDSIHFPKNDKYNDGYFRQLLSEEMRDGKWVKKHAKIRNEALDIKVYNLALLEIFKSEISRILSSGKPYLENRKKMVSSRVVSKGIKAFR
jgi:phage terminase large subunit GpA-like protein